MSSLHINQHPINRQRSNRTTSNNQTKGMYIICGRSKLYWPFQWLAFVCLNTLEQQHEAFYTKKKKNRKNKTNK